MFDPNNTNSYTASTAQTIFDTLGNPHTLSLYYVKTSEPGKWQLYTTLDGSAVNGPTDLTFNGKGTLVTPAVGVKLPQNFQVYTGALSPLAFDLDLTGTTQYGIAFGTNTLVQDGYTSGKLSGLSIANDGTVLGRYSNGQSRNMGQLVLANFNNPNGLQSLGNNLWAETTESGSPIPGGPGTGNLGLVKSGALEDANVDLTAELVNMITAQRAYQANAQSIKTQDQIMQTLVNLR
ncbi:MAG: flagellar hook-basal body complex protein [Sterolibacterium sp.]|nr:flagellar hook-basal body complex protein [Sterolibacterium sp.]